MSQPEPLTYQRSPCQNKGNFFLLHCGCVFLHGLQVSCFFVFGLATYTVTVKANIKHFLTCLLISLFEAKPESQQLQNNILKSPSIMSFGHWYRNDWLLHSPPQATFTVQFPPMSCRDVFLQIYICEREEERLLGYFWKILSVLESQFCLHLHFVYRHGAWNSVQPTSKPGHERTVYSLDICKEMKRLLDHIYDIGATDEKFGMHRVCLHLCFSLYQECSD